MDALGSTVLDRWELWEETIRGVWPDNPSTYEHFEALAKRIREAVELREGFAAETAAKYAAGSGF